MFQALFNAAPDALLVVDHVGKITLANPMTEKMFGYSAAELLDREVELLVPERLRAVHQRHRNAYHAAPCIRPMGIGLQLTGRCKDGREFPIEIMLSPLQHPKEALTLVVARDLTDRIAAKGALMTERDRSRVTLDSIADAVLSTDAAGNITYLNKVAEEMTGWTREEALHRPLTDVFKTIDGETGALSPDPLKEAIRSDSIGALRLNTLQIAKDGAQTPIEDSVAPIHDEKGGIAGAVIVFRDVSQTRRMNSQMAHLAQHDCLTDLPNRVLLDDRITQAIEMAGRHKTLLAVLFLDLDRFKHVNDSLGHAAGDRLLQSIAKRLIACVRASDTVSRSGGDEFVILLSEVAHANDAGTTAEKIIAALHVPHAVAGHELRVTVSIGISLYPRDGTTSDILIKNADVAMYRAKNCGRNNFQFYTPDMSTYSIERLHLENGLRAAIELGEFTLHYQSKVDIATGAVIGCEALIRWQRPEHGLVPPQQFIAIAEDCGLIVQIGRWVLSEVCMQLRAWKAAGLQLVPVSLNISALEFQNRQFLDNVRTVLAETAVDPHYLEFELTEGVLMEYAESSINVLKELKGMGLQLAIDDFGTGYSSLSYLSYFSIDVLKIDQSFVREMAANPDNALIISAIIGMCEGLNCRVIAEGVETEAQVRLLRERRCREAQGFYFSRPVVAAEFASFLQPIAR